MREMRRILVPGGGFATYDLVIRGGDPLYPTPWARDASASFLLTESETRTALEEAGDEAILWRDDTEVALDFFKTVMATQGQTGTKPRVGHGPGLSSHDQQSRS
jgi:hypothetical protein